MEATRELALLRFLAALDDRLEGTNEAASALRVALRMTRDFFRADAACIAAREPGGGVRLRERLPKEAVWDEQLLSAFVHRRRPRIPHDLLLGFLERRDRPWGGLCLRRAAAPFDEESVGEIARIAPLVARAVQRIDRFRLAEARMRIDHKIMERLRPKDLFYQILHSLRSLTRYDHSAALLIHDAGAGVLELVSEQIAWRKGKSPRVGLVLQPDAGARALLELGEVGGFDRQDGRWRAWDGQGDAALAELLDYAAREPRTEDVAEEPAGAMICAPLASRDGLLGVLKVSSRHPGSLGGYEIDLVRRFLPQAAVAIHNLRRAESLETGMLQAEKKHAVANLARGVSHDINNALGSVLPLVQQMSADAREDRVRREVLSRDLEQLEAALQVCRRIFGGMLAFARGAARPGGEGDVRPAVATTLAVLEETLRRQGIRVVTEIAEGLPPVLGGQGDLEQVLLNLATNACEAMPRGGELIVRATHADGHVEIELADSGGGIAPADLSRVQEPFFTTKPRGNGLGLSICRSIVWERRGRLQIDSRPGNGTRVRVSLPAAGAAERSAGEA